jgi:hypothetical protein
MKRLLLAAIALAALGCSDATTGNGRGGRTRVYLTDAPFPYGDIAAVNVYIARIEASGSIDTTGLNPQQWVTIATPERTFNLLDFQGGTTTLLGEADLPADEYAAVRVVVNTNRSSVVRNDGSMAPVHWPLSGDLELYAIVEPVLSVPSAGAQIVLDFDVGQTFLDDGNGGFYFSPWIRAVNEAATGSIAGTITATSIEGDTIPVANVAVSAYRDAGRFADSSPPYGLIGIGSGRTDAQGHYVVGYLPAGVYDLVAVDPAVPQLRGVTWGVQVTAGSRTTANLMLVFDTTSTGGTDSTGTDSTGVDTTGAGGNPTGPVASVSISPLAQTISVGDSAGAVAMTYNAQGQMLTGRTITWTLGDSSVVSVTAAAYNWILLRGARSGTVTLTATSEGVAGTATVTVR